MTCEFITGRDKGVEGGNLFMKRKLCTVSEVVPGTQITLCHMIAHPDIALSHKLGLNETAIGIMSVTPSEVAVIAADIMTKSAPIELVFVDRYLGTLLVTGKICAIETTFEKTISFLSETLGFETVPITRS